MMPINLKTLVNVSLKESEEKKNILSVLSELTFDEQFELERTCWENLAEKFSIKLQMESDKLLEEVRIGKRPYNINDFTEIQARLYRELAAQLESGKTEEEIAQVRNKLQEYIKKPVSFPPQNNSVKSQ